MSDVSETIEPDDSSEGKGASDEASRELVLRAKGGDVEAAYNVLGRQFAVDVWVAVLHQLARNPVSVDLELVAHRTLRRPPAVVSAVLGLAGAARTPVAAFLTRVVAESRKEENLRADATSLNGELVALFDVRERLANDDPVGELYALLARPLSEQARLVSGLAADTSAIHALFDAMRGEYERLQDVARDTRWRGGSYRHALRHALADLALVAGVGGRLEDQAFRLLQQRTDEPSANAELLECISPELRSRYLDWSLDRSSAESSPARALFAIEQLGRHGETVDRKVLQRLLGCKDTQVAAAAAAYLLTSDPVDASNDREIAELLATGDASMSRALIAEIATKAPQRLRADLWPTSLDPLVTANVTGNADGIERLTSMFRESSDSSVRLRLLRVLAEAGGSVDDRGDVGRAVASAVIDRPDGPAEDELPALLSAGWLREGAWAVLDRASNPARANCLQSLVSLDEPGAVWANLSLVHARLDKQERDELERFVLDAVANGQLNAEEATKAASAELLEALKPEAEERTRSAGSNLERLLSLIALGDRAAEVELRELLEPLIDRAIERSTGNERLTRDYEQLRTGTNAEPSTADDETNPRFDDVDLSPISASLEGVGMRLVAEGENVTAVLDATVATQQIVRALAMVDQRLGRATAGPGRNAALAALAAIATEAVRLGAAEEILRDLFERGPLFQAAIALSPEARSIVVQAAIDAGFEPPDSWREHAVLGGWLADVMGETTAVAAVPSTAADALIALQRTENERREAEDRLRAGRAAARHSFVDGVNASLDDLEQTVDTYVQLWLALGRLGIQQIAALGQILAADELDPSRHELVSDAGAASYVVRSGGVEIEGEVVRRARVEAFD